MIYHLTVVNWNHQEESLVKSREEEREESLVTCQKTVDVLLVGNEIERINRKKSEKKEENEVKS